MLGKAKSQVRLVTTAVPELSLYASAAQLLIATGGGKSSEGDYVCHMPVLANFHGFPQPKIRIV